jgi:hypothetical protein
MMALFMLRLTVAPKNQEEQLPEINTRPTEQLRAIERKRNCSIPKKSRRNPKTSRRQSRWERQCLQVEAYIQSEKDKCARLCIPHSEQNYLPLGVSEWISTLRKEEDRVAASIMSTAIGSAESIALLQHIVGKIRTGDAPTNPGESLELFDRVREIQRLSGQIVFIGFLRRCHVWKLYTDASHDLHSPDHGFVIVTSKSISHSGVRRAGNPRNFLASEITKAMISGMAPEVESDSEEYQRLRKYCAKLRQFGQRLEILTETFGFGVLGLISPCDTLGGEDLTVGIGDETSV